MTTDIKITVVSPPEFYREASAVLTMGTTSANADNLNTMNVTDTPLTDAVWNDTTQNIERKRSLHRMVRRRR